MGISLRKILIFLKKSPHVSEKTSVFSGTYGDFFKNINIIRKEIPTRIRRNVCFPVFPYTYGDFFKNIINLINSFASVSPKTINSLVDAEVASLGLTQAVNVPFVVLAKSLTAPSILT